MKSKIFKRSILALMALLAVSTISFAQETSVPPVPAPAPTLPPLPPVAPLNKLTPPDSKDFQLKMKDLHIKVKDLQVCMNKFNLQHQLQMNLKMKGFDKQFKHLDKNFTYKLNDSAMNLACDFSNIAPQIALGFKDFDTNFSYSIDTDKQHDEGVEKVKNYSKSYSIDGNDVINLDNRYGKITVNTWSKSEVKVDVEIKVGANDDDMAQKLLDKVSIRDSKDGSGVYFKTNINSDDSDGSWSIFVGKRNKVHKVEVNYTVYMPSKNPLNVSNKYGSINLPDLDGKLVINNSYGNLVTKALSNPSNQISVKYGSATIGSLNGSDLDVAYGSLSLGECNKLNADISYGSAKIGRITTSGNINVRFSGNLNISEVDKNIKSLSVNSSYSSVKLGISNGQNADFDVTVRYGSFNYGGHDINITSKSPSDNDRGYSPTKNYKGHLGKGSNDKNITVNTSYGSVSFE